MVSNGRIVRGNQTLFKEASMNCPYCQHQDHLEIDLHADGFCADLIECSECGTLLVIKGGKLETLHGPAKSSRVMVA